MPELPHVELFRRTVEGEALHRTVETVSVPSDELLVDTSASSLRDALLHHRLTATLRHGKHLFVRSGEERSRWLRLHFGMSGSVEVWDGESGDAPDHLHLRLELRGGTSLGYRCPRKLGEIGLVDDPAGYVEEAGLGPDPWGGELTGSFGARDFREALEGRRGMVKPALMDQEVLAGLGNVYVDEILFQEGVHPETGVDALGPEELDALWSTLDEVLQVAVDAGADPERLPDGWLLPAREAGAPCPRCGGTLEKTEVSGRATYLCPEHQTRR